MPPVSTGTWVGDAQGGCDSCASQPCSGALPPDKGVLTFSDDTGFSSLFTVTDAPVIIRVMRNFSASKLALEMVEGCGAGDEFAAVVLPDTGALLCPQGVVSGSTMMFVPFTGRYRLVGDVGKTGADDLHVTVRETTIPVDWAALVVRQCAS